MTVQIARVEERFKMPRTSGPMACKPRPTASGASTKWTSRSINSTTKAARSSLKPRQTPHTPAALPSATALCGSPRPLSLRSPASTRLRARPSPSWIRPAMASSLGSPTRQNGRVTGAHGLEWKDGKVYVASPPSQFVHVMDASTWEEVHSFRVPGLRVHGLAWADDGTLWGRRHLSRHHQPPRSRRRAHLGGHPRRGSYRSPRADHPRGCALVLRRCHARNR